MRIRRKFTIILVALGLVAGAAGTALAAPGGPNPGQAVRCENGAQRLAQLEALADQLAGQVANVQTMLASGELTPRQAARAEQYLSRLQERQANLAGRIGALSARLTAECSPGTGGGGGGE